METREALEVLRDDVSGYFCDEFTDTGIEYMREDILRSKGGAAHPGWRSVRTAFETVLERCTEDELTELVTREFNKHIPALPGGAKGFLADIYREVFG